MTAEEEERERRTGDSLPVTTMRPFQMVRADVTMRPVAGEQRAAVPWLEVAPSETNCWTSVRKFM